MQRRFLLISRGTARAGPSVPHLPATSSSSVTQSSRWWPGAPVLTRRTLVVAATSNFNCSRVIAVAKSGTSRSRRLWGSVVQAVTSLLFRGMINCLLGQGCPLNYAKLVVIYVCHSVQQRFAVCRCCRLRLLSGMLGSGRGVPRDPTCIFLLQAGRNRSLPSYLFALCLPCFPKLLSYPLLKLPKHCISTV